MPVQIALSDCVWSSGLTNYDLNGTLLIFLRQEKVISNSEAWTEMIHRIWVIGLKVKVSVMHVVINMINICFVIVQ